MIKNIIKNFLSLFNLKIIKLNSSKPYDLTKKNINPINAQYIAGQEPFIITIDLNKGRTNNWFELTNESLDPGIFTINNAIKKNLKNEELLNNIAKNLKECYYIVKLKDAAETLNIKTLQDSYIKKYPWWATVYPWENYSFEEKKKNFPFDVKKNREINGMFISTNNPDEIIRKNYEDGWLSHAKQYVYLLNQIKKNGFNYGSKYGYINAEIFIDNNMFRWKPGLEGNHRTTIAAALGFKEIPVLVTKIIRIEDLEYWPNVVKGYFDKEQAKKIFYNIFDAKPSSIYEEWIKKTRNY